MSTPHSSGEFDFIIVGSGAAGSVLAARLAESPSIRVLLLEAGPGYPRTELATPLASFGRAPNYVWNCYSDEQTSLNGRRVLLPVGKVMGGSMAINAMIYIRGNKLDFDDWHSQGNSGWSFSELLPYFKKAECFEDGENRYHGGQGPLSVSYPRNRDRFSLGFVEACVDLGLKRNPDFNAADQDGVGFFQLTQKNGRRVTSATAYLGPRTRQMTNLTVLSSARATRILFKGQKAYGVDYMKDNVRHQVFASGEIILASGAIYSPHLLLVSGIGPAAELRRLKISVVADLPGVGQNLQDHVRLPVQYFLRSKPRQWYKRAEVMYKRSGVGPLCSNNCEAGAFVRTQAGVDRPDLQFIAHWASSGGRVGLEPVLLSTRSAGRLRLRSADPLEDPIVNPRYLSAQRELDVLAEGITMARELARTKSLGGLVADEAEPGKYVRSKKQFERYIRNSATTAFHFVGTCKMGRDSMAVVDSCLRVRGIDGLRVADASIMPRIVTGNTAAAVTAIGEKAAGLILNR